MISQVHSLTHNLIIPETYKNIYLFESTASCAVLYLTALATLTSDPSPLCPSVWVSRHCLGAKICHNQSPSSLLSVIANHNPLFHLEVGNASQLTRKQKTWQIANINPVAPGNAKYLSLPPPTPYATGAGTFPTPTLPPKHLRIPSKGGGGFFSDSLLHI